MHLLRNSWVSTFAICALAFLLAGSDLPEMRRTNKARKAAAVGCVFPAFNATTLGGRTLDNSMLQGRVTLVSAWRIGCAFCMLEIPEYNQLVDSIRDPRFQVISFAPHTLDELAAFHGSDTTLTPCAARVAMGTPVPAYDVIPMCSTKREKDPHVLGIQCDALEDMLGADGFPVTFIVGPDGVIRHRHEGLIADPVTYRPNLGRFKQELDSLLKVL